MKKIIIRTLCILLAVALVVPMLPSDSASAVEAEGNGFTQEDFLTVRGRSIVNRDGDKVTLQGVNLGALLLWEDWISPYEEETDHYDVVETLEERFGAQAADRLIDTFEDNWITEYDLDEIKRMGFNCVRVPFWYRNFYSDDDGTKRPDENGEWDFSRLDWIVEECSERRIYVVLDLHGAPGFQNDAPHSGKRDSCRLYDRTDEGERYRALTDELWIALAERFCGNPTIAMYDLLNEPMCNVPSTMTRRRINNQYIYERLYNTVRAVDGQHIITLECIWDGFALPKTWMVGWENVVYQTHFYNLTNWEFVVGMFLTILIHPNVPFYMGEFHPLARATWNGCFGAIKRMGFSWSVWTYKGAGYGMEGSDWCIFGSKNGFERAKVRTDTYDEIARKWGECLRTENGYTDTGLYEKIEPYIG